MNKNKNYWKLSFFVLLGIIIGFILFVTINVFTNREEEVLFNKTKVIEGEPSFQLKLNKSQTNELLNHYFNNFQKDTKISYSFAVENFIVLKGSIPILGTYIDFYVYFQPFILENKDLKLKTKSISIGTLLLPASEILNYVKNEYKFPDWVKINPNDETIYFELSNYETPDKMKFNIEKLDLIDDEVIINVFLNK